jgi:hypothetical protein
MQYIGLIEWPNGASEVDRQRWLKLIDTHGSLAQVPPRSGINPFTRKPTQVYAPRSTATVVIRGAEVGNIGWSQDDSPALEVNAKEDAVGEVCHIARDVATKLGAQFVPETSTA